MIYYYDHIQELEAFPKDYTIEMAIQNNNVVQSNVLPYNIDRLNEFISNVYNGIPDKITIARFGFDDPIVSSISIMEFDGDLIIYTTDNRNWIDNRYTLIYGDRIEMRLRVKDYREIIDYYFITLMQDERLFYYYRYRNLY